jgi:hypothetical protein
MIFYTNDVHSWHFHSTQIILTWLKFDSEPSAAITQGISAFEFNIKLERKKKYFEVKNRKQKSRNSNLYVNMKKLRT